MKTEREITIYISRYYKKYDKFGPTGELLAIQTNLDKEKDKHYCSVMNVDHPDNEERMRKLLIDVFKRISTEIKDSKEELEKHTWIEIEFNQNQYSISAELIYDSPAVSHPQSFLGVGHEILIKKPVKEKDIELIIKILENIHFLGWATKTSY